MQTDKFKKRFKWPHERAHSLSIFPLLILKHAACNMQPANMQHENMTVIGAGPGFEVRFSLLSARFALPALKMSSHSNCRIDLSIDYMFVFFPLPSSSGCFSSSFFPYIQFN